MVGYLRHFLVDLDKITLQLHAELRVYFRNGHDRWILYPEGSIYSSGLSLRECSVWLGSKKVRFYGGRSDSEANSKGLNNGLIKLPRAAKFYKYPFVLSVSIKLQRIIAHIAVEVYGFKSLAKLLRLGHVFFKKENFESFKKRSWTTNFDHCGPRLDFFSCRGFEVQSKPLKHFFSPIA